jgi:hypothetical protein
MVVTILADHVQPETHKRRNDTASLVTLLLPDLQGKLQKQFPSYNFQFAVRARGSKVPSVAIEAGNGLPITDANVNKMLKLLSRDMSSLTLVHAAGWFMLPRIKKVDNMALHRRAFTGDVWRGRPGNPLFSS